MPRAHRLGIVHRFFLSLHGPRHSASYQSFAYSPAHILFEYVLSGLLELMQMPEGSFTLLAGVVACATQ